jgi:hypothetical protein
MPKPRVSHGLAQPSLFDSTPHQPQWEELPLEVRRRSTQLLSELLISRPAQVLLTGETKGGDDE